MCHSKRLDFDPDKSRKFENRVLTIYSMAVTFLECLFTNYMNLPV